MGGAPSTPFPNSSRARDSNSSSTSSSSSSSTGAAARERTQYPGSYTRQYLQSPLSDQGVFSGIVDREFRTDAERTDIARVTYIWQIQNAELDRLDLIYQDAQGNYVFGPSPWEFVSVLRPEYQSDGLAILARIRAQLFSLLNEMELVWHEKLLLYGLPTCVRPMLLVNDGDFPTYNDFPVSDYFADPSAFYKICVTAVLEKLSYKNNEIRRYQHDANDAVPFLTLDTLAVRHGVMRIAPKDRLRGVQVKMSTTVTVVLTTLDGNDIAPDGSQRRSVMIDPTNVDTLVRVNPTEFQNAPDSSSFDVDLACAHAQLQRLQLPRDIDEEREMRMTYINALPDMRYHQVQIVLSVTDLRFNRRASQNLHSQFTSLNFYPKTHHLLPVLLLFGTSSRGQSLYEPFRRYSNKQCKRAADARVFYRLNPPARDDNGNLLQLDVGIEAEPFSVGRTSDFEQSIADGLFTWFKELFPHPMLFSSARHPNLLTSEEIDSGRYNYQVDEAGSKARYMGLLPHINGFYMGDFDDRFAVGDEFDPDDAMPREYFVEHMPERIRGLQALEAARAQQRHAVRLNQLNHYLPSTLHVANRVALFIAPRIEDAFFPEAQLWDMSTMMPFFGGWQPDV